MTLTHQFFITLTLPAAFVTLLLYDWRFGNSRQYGPYWSLTLLVAALWSSSLLSYYFGLALPAEVAATWRIAAQHMLSALALLLLLTTTSYLGTPPAASRMLLALSSAFWLAALFLDPAIWPYRLPAFTAESQQGAYFNLWSAIWVSAWLIPCLAAVMLTRQAVRDALSALYRNRLNYWLTTLVLFTLCGSLALVQEPGQPAWQELGGLGLALVAALGTATLVRSSLPNLRLAVRHLVARLAASLLILALAWLFLFLFVNRMPGQGRSATVLELGLAAAIFTALFGAVNRSVTWFVRRWLLPRGRHRGAIADQPALTTALRDPAALAEILLRVSQFNVATENARLLLVEDRDGGTIRLRPVAAVGEAAGDEPIEIAESSAIAAHFRRR
ncbi:MAG TPA: hypothetical protein VE553_04910, partial [Candidatus Binatia bacterium]|nr:hypothetical protein [Candidatus Binatia bacterium]